ncbi:putative oxidoreductase/Short-chain dehydrogenase [Alkalibacterium sp. AK22]|uniref:SDR family NAD(P)-dependent oxidoreductase n=1 Tax=Alkalibacterium sp. AK22 TaxID=1229520 RepID=UPI00044AE7F2|nr:SDR family NAD(P)-dependent oxidoreductase [Alkalibacterium sp. AK22]EXJ24329.1 putative oxidoreductase/Short-chain dehydrogenase [Alkalibacterium sp. AK22]
MSKSILAITGPTSGIGREAVKILAQSFDCILLLNRNMDKGEKLKQDLLEAQSDIQVDVIKCELSDFSSVQSAAEQIKERYTHIDCLINNAGIMTKTKKESPDGFELMMATNFLGHFLLTHELLPLVLNSQRKQVIVVTSNAYKATPLTPPFFQPKRFSSMKAYSQSKLATLYLAQELHERYAKEGLKTTAIHPGLIATNIFKESIPPKIEHLMFRLLKPIASTLEEGALTIVSAVDDPDTYAGVFSDKGTVKPVQRHGSDFETRRQFIDATLKELTLPAL